jgi:hypothetical protein
MVSLIGATTTESGWRVEAALDSSDDPTAIKVTDEELSAVKLKRAKFHGEWNHTISPRK